MDQPADLLPQRKVSRYRSQRIATAHDSVDVPPLPNAQADNSTQDPLVRSRSRYRQKSVGQNHDRPPAIPEIPQSQPRQRDNHEKQTSRSPTSPAKKIAKSPQRVPQREPSSDQSPRHRLNRRVDSRTTLQSSRSQGSIQEDAKPLTNTITEIVKSSPPPGQLFPPPRPKTPVKLDGPPSSGQIRATKADEALPGEEKGKLFGLFKKKTRRDQKSVDSSGKPKTPNSDTSDVVASSSPPADAPVSAVNAGDRRVLMECGSYKMMYPVTPTTTPVDLIKSAAITMSDPINVKSAVLLEYFGSVGVHRAIRRYEHIRDVMNSWDHDTQNSLLLIDPGTSSSETELGLTGVSKTKPAGKSWTLYYSQSIGKWDKRVVHLKRDGQITLQKDPKKPNEQTNVCHLSDFDIYTPTQEKLKKKIRPPKKHCSAIKSQQKSSMFESTTNFVHFFCTADKTVADDFQNTIQGWRSWYLVHVMGEGAPQAELQQTKTPRRAAATSAKAQHHRMDSVDSHYQLGTFSSLVDLDHFGISRNGTEEATQIPSPARDHFDLAQSSPPPPRRRQQMQLAEDEPLMNIVRRASTKQAQQRRQNSVSHQRMDPASARPMTGQSGSSGVKPEQTAARGLISGAGNPESSTVRASTEHNAGLVRQNTQRRSRQNGDAECAFTGEGLLAQSQDGWGNAKKGRGVLDGSRATGPMVQLDNDGEFVQGSLLQKVQAREGPRGPLLDRERTIEKEVRTGEMF